MAFFNSPCHETPKNAIKKNRTKQPREEKKTEEKKSAFFVMSREWTFSEKSFFRVFELPLLRNAQKNARKKNDKK
jgi:hypothetical protein